MAHTDAARDEQEAQEVLRETGAAPDAAAGTSAPVTAARERGDAPRADRGGRRAAEEAPPREVEAGAVGTLPGTTPVGTMGAVDENRPADLTGQSETAEMSGPRFQPDMLDRPHVIVPQTHADTPGQELSEDEAGQGLGQTYQP